jgi:hypothetical protein
MAIGAVHTEVSQARWTGVILTSRTKLIWIRLAN